MRLRLLRIKKTEIEMGKPLAWDLYDNQGILLLREGFIIESDQDIAPLVAHGLYALQNQTPGQQGYISNDAFTEASSFEIMDKVRARMPGLLLNKQPPQNFDLEIMCLCHMIQQACQQDGQACISIVFMKKEEIQYNLTHALDAALLCEIVATRMDLSSQERLPLLAAALTMNMSMAELQGQLYFQRERLSNEQKKAVSEHPEQTGVLLRSLGVGNHQWLNTVLQHHERLDGTGYPRGLNADDITRLSRILGVADILCAKVSGRDYREAILPDTGLREIFLGTRCQGIDQEIAATLIKALGVYPPGTFVRLQNKELAVITHCGKQAHHPIAKTLVDRQGIPLLRPLRRDCRVKDFSVTEVISPSAIPTAIERSLLWDRKERAA